MGRICAVAGCSNSTYTLERWKAELCDIHGCTRGDPGCTCPESFLLLTFPTEKKEPVKRLAWAQAVNRLDPDTGKNWLPKANDRICSEHFVDGQPTPDNPYPSINLGHERRLRRSRKAPAVRSAPVMGRCKLKKCTDPTLTDAEATSQTLPVADTSDHDHGLYAYNFECPKCLSSNKKIKELQYEFDELKEKSVTPTVNKIEKRPNVTDKFLATDNKVNTYTGLHSINAFNDLLKLFSKKASKMKYWSGCKKSTTEKTGRNWKKTPTKPGPMRKSTVKEELLMVLMKLRLGVINELLGDILGVSPSSVSQIFNTWMKMMSQEVHSLIFWPNKEAIRSVLPVSLSNYPGLRCTIDCTEVFIERPRDLQLQALTWSDYKKHNTVKFLVGIAPNGAITFLSEAWGGRASDRKITRESGFLDGIEMNDVIMADRGFTIHEELMTLGARLLIPPPSSGLVQMTRQKVMDTKKIANARIHVERAIGRMKEYLILKNVLPISLVPLIDNIIVVCAALCNLMPPLVN